MLVVSQAGTAVSFLILGLSTDFTVMLLARMLDGVSGGNILVAQAYVADVTPPEKRSRSMGLIGMAFGLGFVLGPLLGGLLLRAARSRPSGGCGCRSWSRRASRRSPGCSSLLRLPESLPADVRARQAARVVSWRGIVETVSRPGVGLLVADRRPGGPRLRGAGGDVQPLPAATDGLGPERAAWPSRSWGWSARWCRGG